MIVGDIYEVRITNIAFGGSGIARLDNGMACFVPYTVKDELVSVEIVKLHKNYAQAKLINVIEKSSSRVNPPCKLFGSCGGCQYQHITYEDHIEIKKQQLLDTLKRIAGIDEDFVLDVNEVVASDSSYHYRNKLTLQPTRIDEDLVEYGFFSIDNSTLLQVNKCCIANDDINTLIPKIHRTKWGRRNSTRKAPRTCTIRKVATGETPFFLGTAPQNIPWLKETLFDKQISVPLGSFFQINQPVAEKLYSTVTKWLGKEYSTIIDAYCGIGIYSLLLPSEINVISIDSDEQAINAAYYNAMQWGLDNRAYLTEKTEKVLFKHLKKIKKQNSALILNPPRTGCLPKILHAIQQNPPSCIVYVSCNPTTLARDLKKLLEEKTYKLKHIAIFDMFPQTTHFETAVALERL